MELPVDQGQKQPQSILWALCWCCGKTLLPQGGHSEILATNMTCHVQRLCKDPSNMAGKMAQDEALAGKARGLGFRSPETTQMPSGLRSLLTAALEGRGRIFWASWLARLCLWTLGLRDYASKNKAEELSRKSADMNLGPQHVYIHAYVYIYMSTCIYMRVCMYAYMDIYIYVHEQAYMYTWREKQYITKCWF